MVKKKELATNIMSALPFMLIAVASLLALVPEASCSAGKTSAPQQATKKSSSPSEAPPSSSPAFPPHYFDRSTPPLTIRHVSSTEGDLHPPPPPSGRHARLHHPHFPPSSLRRRPSQGGSGGETAPPYAVQMEPLVKYSPRDPLYANEGGAEGEDKKEEKRVAEGPEKEPSQSLDVEEEALVEDLEGGAATLRALHAEDKSSSGHPVHNFPSDSSRVPYSFHSPSPLYGPHPHHGQPPFPQGPRYVILREPEPIIEIIVKESNQTLPEPPPAPVTLTAKPREPVHVFYVKYERKKGKSGGEGDRVVFDTPVPARQPTSPEPLPPVHIPEEIEDAKRSLPIVPLPHPLQLSVETTTLRAVIHPESETVHHPHSRSPALRVTFGEGRAHTQDGEVVEEEQSAPQPSFVAPAWGGAGPSPVPPFRQLPEQHFRGHQGASRYFGPSQPHQQQQFGPQQPTQFPQQQLREGQTPDSRTFPPLSRLPPPPGLGHQSVGQNLYAHGQGIRYGQGFPPPQYHPELQQQQQAHLRQQQLQQFQQQNQQKHLQQLQEQRKQQQHQQNQQHHQHQLNQQHQHHQQQQQHQQGLQFQRFPTQLPPGVPSFHAPQRPHSIPSPPPSAQSYQNHHLVPHGSTAPPFIRLPNHQGGRFPEPPNQRNPATGGDIIKSISHSEQHQVHSPATQAHSISVEHKEHNQLPKGHVSDPQITRNQPVGPQRPHQQQQQFLRQQHQQEYKAQSLNSEPNRQQAPVPNLSVQPQRQQQYNGGTPPAAHNGFNGARPDSANRINNGVSQQQQQHNAVTPSPTPGPSYGTTILHYPTTPSNPILQINSLGLNSDHRGAHPSSLSRGTTPQPPPSTTPTPASTTHKIPDLPDEIPDDLRQQLLSSGILDNADIQILDYDKVGDIPIESLPPEALAGLQGAGSENKPVAVAVPSSRGKEAVEMKVVRYTPGNEEKAVDGLIRHDVEETRVLAPVTTSQEGDVNPEGFRRYLPLRISGERFPLPDVPELRGRNVTSVVVLAPVGFPDRGRERRAEGEAEERAGGEAGELLASGRLNALVKDPSRENFRVWLEAEKKASPEEQAVVLLVSPKDGEPEEKGDIFMLDVGSGQVSQLRGELSAAFVQVAKANAKDSGLVEEGRSKSRR